MVASGLRDPDRPCVLPGDPSWLQEVRYLEEGVLRVVARAAEVAAERLDEDRFVLSVGVLEGAASVIGRLAAETEESADGEGEGETIRVLFLPGWELDYLWQILAVFRRAQAGEPEAAELRELLHDLGYGLDRTVEQITEDLQRVAAMLMLDIPAVHTLAAAALHPLGLPSRHAGPPPDAAAVREAFEQVRAGWAAAGVR
ncbi:hypothetical protein [Streptomyces leeuwenhoekii]|uniref:Uncharacterized protein n=3 Tax=Streptomyces leeuwenhoekii TaxID=1437453 RepID=A0A0F7VPR7_STRLW|nr:hypothetical protein [Streptomyces leeuwenhoekii]CQR59337.1 hypothetical protein [Streptomyces leeuwenhoekii]